MPVVFGAAAPTHHGLATANGRSGVASARLGNALKVFVALPARLTLPDLGR